MDSGKLIAATEAGRILNRSAESVRVYERQGKLPAIRTARGIRLFRECDVRELAEDMAAAKMERSDSGR